MFSARDSGEPVVGKRMEVTATGDGDTALSFSIDRLRADLAEVLEIQEHEIGADDDLLDLGLDSIRLMSLVQRWADAGGGADFGELAERPVLSHWVSVLGRRPSSGAPPP